MQVFSAMRSSGTRQLELSTELNVDTITAVEFAAQTLTRPEEWRGKAVLDAGCGEGRFTELLANYGAHIVGFDMDSIGLARISTKLVDRETVNFAQGDLFSLPFRNGAFDFIYTLGVLHHTPNPRSAFINLTRLLKPGGQIAIWVYPKCERTPVSDLLRPVTTRMPARLLYWIACTVTASYGVLLTNSLLRPRIQAVLYQIRLPWHRNWRWRIHSFLDWYGPRYQFKFSPDEVEQWFIDAGLVEVERCPYQTSVRGRAK